MTPGSSRTWTSAPAVCVAALLMAGGCFDLGYPVLPPGEHAGDGGRGVAPAGCVEGPATPSDEGPQLQFSGLDVDRHGLTIAPGDIVTWTNASSQPHTATAGAPGAAVPPSAGGFDSGIIPGGGRWAWRFCDPRMVEWFCRTHPAQMFGYRIVIE